MEIKTLFNDNRLKVAFTLFLIWTLAVWHFKTLNSFLYPLIAIAFVAFCDLSITFVRDHKFYLPSASLVTGFLIGLIIAPTEKVWIIVAASLAASLSKQLIKAQVRQHIFNPAAFGIIFVSLVFGVEVAWWGVGASKWIPVILIPWKMRRISLPISFLAVYFLYFILVSKSAEAAFVSLLDGSVLLFALVMLPEPITSPVKGQFKWLFGTLVAIFAIGLTQLGILNEVFLPALLISNLVSFILSKKLRQ